MKKLATILLTLSVIGTSAQSILIADNNPSAPGGTNVFPTLQAAIDAATAGDTIYIQPSATEYGTGTTNIELHFRGIGFNLDKDIPYTSMVERINLYGAPDGSTNPSNSSISGLDIDNIWFGKDVGDPSYTLTGVRVFNNSITTMTSFSTTYSTPIDDMVVAYNYISSTFTHANGATNVTIRNNVVDGSIYFSNTTSVTAIIANNIINGTVRKNSISDFLVVQNNNFIGTGNAAFSVQLENTNVVNNIFYGITPSLAAGGNSTSANFENNIFNNNITFSTGNDALPPQGGGAGNTGTGNFPGVDPQFAAATLGTTWQSADDYTTSAAEVTNGGTDASDIGIFGGPYPFNNVNLQLVTSSIPTIQSLNISTVINPNQPLEVDVSAKSN